MKKLVILGSGLGGTMTAAKMRKELNPAKWDITIIDNDEIHHYQPGWLFIPFGIYTAEDCMKPKREFIPRGVNFVLDEIVALNTDKRVVECKKGKYNYDWLVIATGCRISPEEIEGLEQWEPDAKSNVHTFYTLKAAEALFERLKNFKSGRLVFNIPEVPFKCPVAPIEFLFMADWFFRKEGVRDQIEIELVTPQDGIFTKPIATRILAENAEEKGIKTTTLWDLAAVNQEEKTIESHTGDKVGYDLLVSTMPNMGSQYVDDSGLGDGAGYAITEPGLLKSKKADNIYILGDATNVPTSKAGSVAHYEGEILTKNLALEIDGHEPKETFDGHSTCFICSGYEKAFLIDFNYKTEPLPGKYPFPGLGPFELLGESYMNYWGKMLFKWVYWNLLVTGQELPLEPQMLMAGKFHPRAMANTKA
ncbi:MAG: NAD(P)/FAD-dependent oxidoreductase [Proteobacteria bacterium]|nr:NAD(P)/FAD-dependent oxidoreductase [Pseudomonadota bacterium]